jgi:hypothetical protein
LQQNLTCGNFFIIKTADVSTTFCAYVLSLTVAL